MITEAQATTLRPIIRKQIKPDRVVEPDTCGSSKALAVSEVKPDRSHHRQVLANAQKPTNGLENFGPQTKRPLRKFKGIPKKSFPLFLKEGEWRFNHPPQNNR
jgi:transposase-like protein